jgi:hypothetical protein
VERAKRGHQVMCAWWSGAQAMALRLCAASPCSNCVEGRHVCWLCSPGPFGTLLLRTTRLWNCICKEGGGSQEALPVACLLLLLLLPPHTVCPLAPAGCLLTLLLLDVVALCLVALLLHPPQEHFEAVRAAELVATQRMEAAERRKVEEKERRLAQVRVWWGGPGGAGAGGGGAGGGGGGGGGGRVPCQAGRASKSQPERRQCVCTTCGTSGLPACVRRPPSMPPLFPHSAPCCNTHSPLPHPPSLFVSSSYHSLP